MAEEKNEIAKELQDRVTNAMKEFDATQKKYQVKVVAAMDYRPEGALPTIKILDTKEEEKSKIVKP